MPKKKQKVLRAGKNGLTPLSKKDIITTISTSKKLIINNLYHCPIKLPHAQIFTLHAKNQ